MEIKTIIEKLLHKGGGRLSFCASEIEDFGYVDAPKLFRERLLSLGLKQTEWVFAFQVELADYEFPVLELARVNFTVARIPQSLALALSLEACKVRNTHLPRT